jgi:hypothetical protein
MICKYLEKKVSFFTEEIDKEDKYDFDLEYYLIESNERNEGDESTVYGLEIIKRAGENTESKLIRNYSNSIKATRQLIKQLAYNTVTPVSLPFVIDDILGM